MFNLEECVVKILFEGHITENIINNAIFNFKYIFLQKTKIFFYQRYKFIKIMIIIINLIYSYTNIFKKNKLL